VLRAQDEAIIGQPMHWKFVPKWAKSIEVADRYSLINAKDASCIEHMTDAS